jgi:hypothetical protein
MTGPRRDGDVLWGSCPTPPKGARSGRTSPVSIDPAPRNPHGGAHPGTGDIAVIGTPPVAPSVGERVRGHTPSLLPAEAGCGPSAPARDRADGNGSRVPPWGARWRTLASAQPDPVRSPFPGIQGLGDHLTVGVGGGPHPRKSMGSVGPPGSTLSFVGRPHRHAGEEPAIDKMGSGSRPPSLWDGPSGPFCSDPRPEIRRGRTEQDEASGHIGCRGVALPHPLDRTFGGVAQGGLRGRAGPGQISTDERGTPSRRTRQGGLGTTLRFAEAPIMGGRGKSTTPRPTSEL